jgi:hypothetical protein
MKFLFMFIFKSWELYKDTKELWTLISIHGWKYILMLKLYMYMVRYNKINLNYKIVHISISDENVAPIQNNNNKKP